MKELSEAAKVSEKIRAENPATKLSLSQRRLVRGVGVNDSDYMVHCEWIFCPAYMQWQGMLMRCYCAKRLEKKPTYAGCRVSEEWMSFVNFREWWVAHHTDGWSLDKDLIVPGNREYSSETCVFVPQSINAFLVDSGAARGAWPIGVSYHTPTGRLQARCKEDGRQVQLGIFDDAESAHLAWRNRKLMILERLRHEMDSIDERIYVNAKSKILSYAADMRAVA